MTDWRGWLITDEQAELIRGGDILARNAFYFDNLARIRRMARGYMYRRKFTPNWCEFNLDDCVNGLYLDLPFFDFENGSSVSRSVYRSFYYSIFGGWWYISEFNRKLFDRVYQGERLYILDKPVQYSSRSGDRTDDGVPIIDKIISVPSPENEVLDGEVITVETLEIIVCKYLSKQENAVFNDFLNGYERHYICDRLGVKNVSKQFDRLCAKLRANYADIISELSSLGVDLPRYALQVPDDYVKAVKKIQARRGAYSVMTDEQKARAVERTRQWRAKQKAQKNKGQQNVAL